MLNGERLHMGLNACTGNPQDVSYGVVWKSGIPPPTLHNIHKDMLLRQCAETNAWTDHSVTKKQEVRRSCRVCDCIDWLGDAALHRQRCIAHAPHKSTQCLPGLCPPLSVFKMLTAALL